MLYYGNLSRDQEQLIDSAFEENIAARTSPALLNLPASGLKSVPSVVAQLDKENKVLALAECFLAHYENVRFLNLLSVNTDNFGNDLLVPTNATQLPLDESPSPIIFVHRTNYIENEQRSFEANNLLSEASNLPPPNVPLFGDSLEGQFPQLENSSVKVQACSRDSGIPSSIDTSVVSESAFSFAKGVLQQPSSVSWLVPDRDTPQKLLPLPFSLPAIPPEWNPVNCTAESRSEPGLSALRGSEDWAPPRFQIILTVQSQIPVAQAAEKQRFRCAGCGHLVDKRYLRSLRYCYYYGKYFCTQCHTGQKAIIPATILSNWDFAPLLISEQAAELLVGIAHEPYFFVAQINPVLFKKHRALRDGQRYRLQLAYLATYIKQCREAKREQEIIGDSEHCPVYWCEQANPTIYSISDLVGIRNKKVLNRWKDLMISLRKHVISCQACTGRGYVCEGCWRRDDVIFPFDVDNVVICPVCRFCFHRPCHPHPENPDRCPRCNRLEQRRLLSKKQDADVEEVTLNQTPIPSSSPSSPNVPKKSSGRKFHVPFLRT